MLTILIVAAVVVAVGFGFLGWIIVTVGSVLMDIDRERNRGRE